MKFISFKYNEHGFWESTFGGTWCYPTIEYENEWINGIGYNLYEFINDWCEHIVEEYHEEMEEIQVLLTHKTGDDISNLVYSFLNSCDEVYKSDEYLEYYKDRQKIIDEILCQSEIDFETMEQITNYICENI